MFMVLSSWQSHCESLPSSFDECRITLSDRRPKTMSDDLGCEFAYTRCPKNYSHYRHLLLLSSKADIYFTILRRVES